MSASRLRGRDLLQPIRGVRLPASHADLPSRCRAFALHRRTPYAFSHATAAMLLGIPLPRRFDGDSPLHVTVPAPTRAPVVRGVIGHKSSDLQSVLLEGIPITPPARTWCDLSSLLLASDLVVAGDFLVTGRPSLCTPDELAAASAARRGRRGAARLAQAARHVRVGAESPQETRLRLLLTARGLPEPAINHEVRAQSGAFLARVDLAYPQQRVAIEYEGDVHRLDLRVFRNDIARRERVEDLGWRMLRVTADDLYAAGEDRLVERVRRALRPVGARGE